MIPVAVALAFLAGVLVGVWGAAVYVFVVLLTFGAAGRGAGGRDA